MTEGDGQNPYRAPLSVQREIDEEPSLLRLVAMRLTAAGLAGVAVILTLLLVALLVRDPLRLISSGTVVQVILIVAAAGGAHMMWVRAALTTQEVKKLDAAIDLQSLVVIAERVAYEPDDPHDFGTYSEKSNRELAEIFEKINPDKAGERYDQLLNTIRKRIADAQNESV